MRGVDDTGDSDYLKTIEMHENALKNFPSVGAYFGSLETCKNVILRRETYENEFYKICEVQGINPDRYFGAIFYQRPLKKGKIAFCNLEQNRKVTHASNPLYQRFRILRDVNNIEIFDIENNQIEISAEHRQEFVCKLLAGNNLTKAGCLKIMGLKKPASYKWYSGKAITGNFWVELIALKDDIKYQIWQDLISATENVKLVNILLHKGFSETDAAKIAEFDIKGMGYADYSEKAIKKLLPLLEKGKTLNESILEIYGKVDFGASVALRNVVLEQVHSSCASLIKAVKEKYEIGEMQIEIDTLLKMGNKARKARATANRRADKDNAELDRRIIAEGAEPTDYNRKKLRLYDEIPVCPYFPDEKIELKDLFTEKYNLDHIVPKSKFFDFSDENLVLCPKSQNFEKLRTTGRDYVESQGAVADYCDFVNALKISERKKALLLMREADIPTDYVSRSAGTDYNTRCFLALHKNSRCIPNKLVNMYAKKW
jgi:CRISPR-associated endonuclease Csn1